jgi:lysozyme
MDKITNVSESLIKKTKKSEKFVSKPYKCPAGVWTIGYGTTRYFDTGKKVTGLDKAITPAEGDRLIRGHFRTVVSPLVDKLCRDDLDQEEFDSIADFIYNAGATYVGKDGKVHYYNLFEKVNKKIPKDEMTRYWENLAITGGGVKLNGLIARRKEEVELYYS